MIADSNRIARTALAGVRTIGPTLGRQSAVKIEPSGQRLPTHFVGRVAAESENDDCAADTADLIAGIVRESGRVITNSTVDIASHR
jgi:hypothetical protein